MKSAKAGRRGTRFQRLSSIRRRRLSLSLLARLVQIFLRSLNLDLDLDLFLPSKKKRAQKAEDTGDVVTFMFESKNADRISDFELKLMDIDSEQLGIPDSEYGATVRRRFGF